MSRWLTKINPSYSPFDGSSEQIKTCSHCGFEYAIKQISDWIRYDRRSGGKIMKNINRSLMEFTLEEFQNMENFRPSEKFTGVIKATTEALCDICPALKINGRCMFGSSQDCEDIKCLMPLPSAQPERKGEWIPCSERLPEFDEKVIAFVKNKDHERRFNMDGVYIAELKDKTPEHDPEGKRNFWGIPGFDSEWTVWAWSYFTEPDVIAWMPLPEPYEGE